MNDLDKLKETYKYLSFFHNKILTTPLYLEEFQLADSAMKWLQSFADDLAKQISEVEHEKRD